jgi:periplasmic protein TonB
MGPSRPDQTIDRALIVVSATDHPDDEAILRMLARWAAAGVCIVAAHGGLAWAVMNWPHPAITAAEPSAAVMIEFAPLAVSPDTPPNEFAVGPQMMASEAITPTESKEEPIEQQEPPSETVKPIVEEPKPATTQEIDTAPLPEIEGAVVVLSPSVSPPPQTEKLKEVERKPVNPKKPEPKKPEKRAAQTASMTAAPQPVDAARANTNASPMAGVSSSISPATWRSALQAHLNRHKRPPAGAGRGVSEVAVTIDRAGRVLAARLARSSGHATLDQEAVALAHRASPVPPPPPDVGKGGNVALVVPVRFNE